MRTLVIEDDTKTAGALANGLGGEGFLPTVAQSGEEGLLLATTEDFDVIVVDWMLPRCDGLNVVRTLRDRGYRTPILMLTARDAVEDRVLGLEAGADDYLVKPFAFTELVARLRALVRRAGSDEPLCRQCSNLVIDLRSRRVTRAGREISLTPREFDLLAYLVSHHGRPVTRGMIAREVWRESNRATPLDNVIDVHLAHLRRKVDEGYSLRLIHTVRGVGFVVRAETAQ